MCPTGGLGCKIPSPCLMLRWETAVLGFSCVSSTPGNLGDVFWSQINHREHKPTLKPLCWDGRFALLGLSPGLRLPRGWQQMGRIPPCSQTHSCSGKPPGWPKQDRRSARMFLKPTCSQGRSPGDNLSSKREQTAGKRFDARGLSGGCLKEAICP